MTSDDLKWVVFISEFIITAVQLNYMNYTILSSAPISSQCFLYDVVIEFFHRNVIQKIICLSLNLANDSCLLLLSFGLAAVIGHM